LLVIGSGGHVLAVRRLLAQVAGLAERDRRVPGGQAPQP
jgi:hypothetical protein